MQRGAVGVPKSDGRRWGAAGRSWVTTPWVMEDHRIRLWRRGYLGGLEGPQDLRMVHNPRFVIRGFVIFQDPPTPTFCDPVVLWSSTTPPPLIFCDPWVCDLPGPPQRHHFVILWFCDLPGPPHHFVIPWFCDLPGPSHPNHSVNSQICGLSQPSQPNHSATPGFWDLPPKHCVIPRFFGLPGPSTILHSWAEVVLEGRGIMESQHDWMGRVVEGH